MSLYFQNSLYCLPLHRQLPLKDFYIFSDSYKFSIVVHLCIFQLKQNVLPKEQVSWQTLTL